ncbi:hypothetical protein D3C80_1433140 [compost metagenome]
MRSQPPTKNSASNWAAACRLTTASSTGSTPRTVIPRMRPTSVAHSWNCPACCIPIGLTPSTTTSPTTPVTPRTVTSTKGRWPTTASSRSRSRSVVSTRTSAWKKPPVPNGSPHQSATWPTTWSTGQTPTRTVWACKPPAYSLIRSMPPPVCSARTPTIPMATASSRSTVVLSSRPCMKAAMCCTSV